MHCAQLTHLQISQSSDPGARVASVLPADQLHQLSVDERAGDGGQVTIGEAVLAEKLRCRNSSDQFIHSFIHSWSHVKDGEKFRRAAGYLCGLSPPRLPEELVAPAVEDHTGAIALPAGWMATLQHV